MKRNRKYNLFGWLAVSTLLLTTACAGVADLDGAQTDIKGSNTVTLTVQSQTRMGSMRDAKEDPLTKNITISRGDKADVLIFAVYKEENGEYKVDKKFAKGNQSKYTGLSLADNQTAIDVESYPIKLQFVFEDNTNYKVAFWAQNGETKAYDTNDLQNVKVNYNEAKNNDELRDAFCAVSPVLNSSTKQVDQVILRRPLAQVNVGSTGWDYEGAAYLKPSNTSYTQSTITLKGVAQYYDILGEKAIVDNDSHKTTDVTFSNDTIPAFINVEGEQWKDLSYKPFPNEEFLKVHVNTGADDKYVPYVGWKEFDDYRLDTTVGDDGKSTKEKYEDGVYPSTETFKYLSMCYVLVPENTSTGNEGKLNSVLSSVEFKFNGITADVDGNFNINDPANFLSKNFVVNNVPVQKNYRTNILGNAFFTYSPKFIIDVVPEYMGNFNYDGEVFGDPSQGDEWPGTHSISFEHDKSDSHTGKVGLGEEDSFFSFSEGSEHAHAMKYTGRYNGVNYKAGLKLQDAYTKSGTTIHYETDVIKFTTKLPSTVIIVQCKKSTDSDQTWTGDAAFMFDGKEQLRISAADLEDDMNSNVLVYTLEDVPAGDHAIATSNSETNQALGKNGRAKQPGLFYIKVIPINIDDKDTNFEDKYGDDYNKSNSTGK